MRTLLQLTYRNVTPSKGIERAVHRRAAKLERIHQRITTCRVMVEAPHNRHRKGNLYHVRIDLGVPGSELVVTRNPAKHSAHEDVFTAIRDAFEAAGRELRSYVARRRDQEQAPRELPRSIAA
jgi:ribosome-associated translation inhibitor RaiA